MDLPKPPQIASIIELQEWCRILWQWLQELRMNQNLLGSATWDPGSIPDGDEEAKEITVTGAALGDFALGAFSNDVADLVLDAQVTAANTVTCILANNTGGAIDLASGTVYAMVIKKQE